MNSGDSTPPTSLCSAYCSGEENDHFKEDNDYELSKDNGGGTGNCIHHW